MVMIGFGSIGQGVLPLIFRHIDIKPEQITIISAEDRGGAEGAEELRRHLHQEAPDPRQLPLDPGAAALGKGDFLVNLSVEVASTALVELCQEKGALYIDTCIEPWPGGYTDPNLSVSLRSNYALRENMLKLVPKYRGGPTAVIAHGANPGPGLALRQAGAGQPRQRHRRGRRRADHAARAGASWRATSASR